MTFVYDEQVGEGNGISLKNALPISDEQGKILAGSNQTFDFQVLAAIEGENVSYEVIAEKQVGSDLPENLAKIYLTTLDGMEESPVSTTLDRYCCGTSRRKNNLPRINLFWRKEL